MNKISLLGSMLGMGKRLITEKQEQILRACHHDFDGLSQADAAEKLSISQSAISDALKHIEKILPQMFPLLTKVEAERYHLYMVEGWSVEDISEYFGLTPDSIYKALQRAKDKGMFFTEAKSRVLSYSPEMDNNVIHKF